MNACSHFMKASMHMSMHGCVYHYIVTGMFVFVLMCTYLCKDVTMSLCVRMYTWASARYKRTLHSIPLFLADFPVLSGTPTQESTSESMKGDWGAELWGEKDTYLQMYSRFEFLVTFFPFSIYELHFINLKNRMESCGQEVALENKEKHKFSLPALINRVWT